MAKNQREKKVQAMNISIRPNQIRTNMPIFVEVLNVDTCPHGRVTRSNVYDGNSFRLEFAKIGDKACQSNFWLDRPGDYDVVLSNGTEKTLNIEVEPQVFLSFQREFGFFTLLFIVFMLGMGVWVFRIRRKEKMQNV